MKKVLITLIAVLLAVTFVSVPAFAELDPDNVPEDAVMYRLDMDDCTLEIDFEEGFVMDGWSANPADLGIADKISFIEDSSLCKIVAGEEALSGEQSFVNKGYLDARIWSLSLIEGVGDYVFVECKFKPINFEGTGAFAFCFCEPDVPASQSEGNGGWIYKVQKKEDKIVCINRAQKVMAELEEGKTYTLAAAFTLGDRYYDFFVDGVRVAEKNKWIGDVNGLDAFRIDSFGPGWDQDAAIAVNPFEFALDDIIVTYGDIVTKAEYFATPEPTPEPTATPEPTDEPTKAPEATEAPTFAPKDNKSGEKKGCKSVVVSSVAIAAVALLGAVAVLKKRH